jgi:hypothetical protein
MADFDSSLPVRTEADGTDARLHAKIVDGVTPSQRMTVDADLNAHVEVHGNNSTGGDETLRLSELGHPNADGVYDATNNIDPSSNGVIAHTRAASPADTDQIKRVTAITNGTNHSLDVSMHDGAGLGISTSNPLPVTFSEGAGAEIHSYTTSSAVAAGASVDHEYTVSAAVSLFLKQVISSGSGKIGVLIKRETAAGSGTFTTYAAGFNSTATPNIDYAFSTPLVAATGVKIRVTIKNRDNTAQDVYSTIIGVEAA